MREEQGEFGLSSAAELGVPGRRTAKTFPLEPVRSCRTPVLIGKIGLREVPRDGIHFSMRSGLEGEYEKVVDEYSDLVGRFNAAIDRCNGLQDILNSVIRALRG